MRRETQNTRIRETLSIQGQPVANLNTNRARDLSNPNTLCLQHQFPLPYIENHMRWRQLELGRMNIECPDCGALHWIAERILHSGKTHPKFEKCCKHGSVSLPLLQPPPEPLYSLLNGQDPEALAFRHDLRPWNSAFSFTSVAHNLDRRTTAHGSGICNFQIHGELYHLQGPLEAPSPENARYSQMYLYDPEYATNLRATRNSALDGRLLNEITEMLYSCSPWIQISRTAFEQLAEQAVIPGEYSIVLNPQLQLIVNSGADSRRANLSTATEVAMIVPEEYGEKGFWDIVLAQRTVNEDGNLIDHRYHRINQNHAAYFPLHYVMMFPRGESGWHWALELNNPDGQRQRVRMGQRTFYRFRLHPRINEPNTIFQCQMLFQQLVVDIWAAADQNKLLWIRHHQANLRTDLYNGLADILQ